MADTRPREQDLRPLAHLRAALTSAIAMKQNFCQPDELADELLQAIQEAGYTIVRTAKLCGCLEQSVHCHKEAGDPMDAVCVRDFYRTARRDET